MSVEIKPAKIAKVAAEMTVAGFLLSLPGTTGVTIVHHRQDTHRSLEADPEYEDFVYKEMRVYSPTPKIWADVHRNHHRYRDVSLAPFMRIARAIDWMEANPDKAKGVDTPPDSYLYLDPKVTTFSKQDVLDIGHSAEEDLQKRTKGLCPPPTYYTKEKLEKLLNPTGPMYYYTRHKRNTDYTQEEIEDRMSRDPHSPLLVPDENGVRAVLLRNAFLYSDFSHMLRDIPQLRSPDLQTGEVIDHKMVRLQGFVDGTLEAAELVYKYRNKHEPGDDLIALAAGLGINLIKLGFHIAGGNITNSYGHAGETTPTSIIQATLDNQYHLVVNPKQGTASTDSVTGGVVGKSLSAFTFDEVGGQDAHHKFPNRIAYTLRTGFKGFIDAWWGTTLEALANNKDFPYLNPGKGFPGVEFEDRPDMPNRGVLLVEKRRVEEAKHLKILQAA
ncbi:MAG: hypothetical protein AAB414_03680 [Patescibacteria group bacterium]